MDSSSLVSIAEATSGIVRWFEHASRGHAMVVCQTGQTRLQFLESLSTELSAKGITVQRSSLAPFIDIHQNIDQMLSILDEHDAVIFDDLGFVIPPTLENIRQLNLNRERFARTDARQLWLVRDNFRLAMLQGGYDFFSWFMPMIEVEPVFTPVEIEPSLPTSIPTPVPENVQRRVDALYQRFQKTLAKGDQTAAFDLLQEALSILFENGCESAMPQVVEDGFGEIGVALRTPHDKVLEEITDPGLLVMIGIALNRKADLKQAIKVLSRAIELLKSKESPESRPTLASAYINRGIALKHAHDVASSIADYSLAISEMESIRGHLEPSGQWSAWLMNYLASAYMNRGVARQGTQDFTGSISDYDTAISLMELIRGVLEPSGQWSAGLINDLAGAYMNRGNASRLVKDYASSVSDYGQAISLLESLRGLLEPSGRWSVDFKNDLATAYMNRGNFLQEMQDFPGALSDYDEAISLRESVRRILQPTGQWSPGLMNSLASTYMNRGTARQRLQDCSGSNSDYSLAISLMESIRQLLEPQHQWNTGLMSSLATAYMNRGSTLLLTQDFVGSISDYGTAISVMEAIRGLLEPYGQWNVGLMNDLSSAYLNQGIAFAQQGVLTRAFEEFDCAIEIQAKIRAELENSGNWFGALKANYEKTIQIREALLAEQLTAE